MGDVQYIVDKLNATPFSMGLTMLSFSEKAPTELLQLLSDVFTAISNTHKALNVGAVGLDQAVEKLMFFLRIVKYKPNMDMASLRQALAVGERSVISSVLKWVLPQAQQLEKRAFVGYYLSFPDMPEELLYDQDVMDLREAIKGLHQEFIAVHKEHDTAKAAVKDLPSLKTQLKQLQEEQERLTDKVARAKQVAAALPDADSYRELCAALRRQHDEEVSISQQLQAQRQQLERAEQAYQRAAGRLRDMQSSTQGQLTGEKLLAALQEDVGRMRAAVSERYPRDLQVKQQRLASLQETLGNGVNTEVDVQRLSSQAGALQTKIQASQERQAAAERARQGDRAYLQVRQAQQMLTLVNKKKAELASKLERLQEQEDTLRHQLDGSAAAAASTPGAVSDEEWRAKYEAIKSKLPQYKVMKKELSDLEAEAAVLGRTEALLKQQEVTATVSIERLERKQGITGYSEVAAGLEAVSEAKGQLDEAKGAMLEEISNTVTTITNTLRARKAQLAPQIAQLRDVRSAHQELQAQHDKAKAEYDADVGALEAKAAALSTTVQELGSEKAKCEGEVEALQHKVEQLDEQLKQLAGGQGEAALKASYQKQLMEAEARLRQLREQQRTIKERHANGLQQRDMLGDLVRLLKLKMQLLQGVGSVVDGTGEGGGGGAGCGPGLAGQSFHTATANVMVL